MGFDESVLICDEVDPILNKILVDNGLKVSYEPTITAEQIQTITSFSERGKSLGSSTVEILACSRQGDSLMNNAAGMAIAK